MTPAPITELPKGKAWYSQSAEETLAQLKSSEAGLTVQEAGLRLTANGPNALKEGKRISPLQIIFDQFKSLIIWVLIAAGVVSGLLGEMMDAIAIFAIVVLNAVIGFYQEFKAEQSIAALKKMTAPEAKVLRDGKVTSIPASGIVSGDILALEAGDLIAADARLLEAASLKCIEATLTGELLAVIKRTVTLGQGDIPLADRENMVFMGTSVAMGTGQAVVVATAMQTELGRIAGLIEKAGEEEQTPLEKKLESFGQMLIWAALGIVALLFGLGLLRGTDLFELSLTSVSLAVAAVPEGLPAVVTVALSLGVLRMSRRHALVRKLAAVETLGSTTTICTDKTGTLTMGEMTVRALYVANQSYEVTGLGYEPEGEVRFEGKKAEVEHAAPLLELATIILGCNNAHLVQEKENWKVIGDPTEGALLAAGAKAGGDYESIERKLPKQQEIPFDSDRKLSTMIRKMQDGKLRAFINGAPDVLLERCTNLYAGTGVRPMTDEDRQTIVAQNTAMAQQALRVLGSAYRDLDKTVAADLTADDVEHDLVFVGLSGMVDPPRQEAKDAVAKCRAAGIRVVMITGDHPDTATAIAREIGIASDEDRAVSGIELDKMSDRDLLQHAPEIAVYARVTAEHKLRIIRAWQTNDAVVAMTGDGVNDAPAIKGADIGIAMGRAGTEVTKQAADMIITDDNFASIVAAVEEGRGIYDNIRKTLQYLLAGNTGELLLMTVCVIIGLPTPLLPIHLLWINLVTDGLPALCLATDPIDSDVMNRSPRPHSERITTPKFLRTMAFTGILTAGVAFVVYWYMLKVETTEIARTYAFSVLVFAELLRSFGVRSESKPVWRISLFTNINLMLVVAVSFGLQVWSQHNETLGRFLKTSYMPFSDSLLLLALGAIPLLILEIVKVVRLAGQQRKTAPFESATRLNQKTSRVWTIPWLALKKFSVIDGAQWAGAFSYYAFFSLFPLVILFVTIASIFIDQDRAGIAIIAYVETYVPMSGDKESYIFDAMTGVVEARGQMGVVAFLMLAWAALQIFTTLISATNRAWGSETSNWWRRPLKSLVFLVIMVCVVLLSVAVPVLAKLTQDWLIPIYDFNSWVYTLGNFFISSLVVFLSLSLFYQLAPSRPTRFAEVWIAALCATAFLYAAEHLFVVYLKDFATLNAVYGVFGGIMALLLWIYLFGCIFIFGACLCAAQAEERSTEDPPMARLTQDNKP
ncbi:HAD-IC family P-type ATPase [Methylotuvimicrobium alcaliphilum]|uniref:P-type Cu(+) transporter n=1 Tax=Methylotuvimicrobium alcaliphilum (strain DSM 19304 / NCIMB 14124 / VKM B-2133 / 20Z) TaxID=1091494 RepID=G4SX92_META2|nr:HAD-IC family P-type ATPase [Methylotuvimicrobium alcaliphilum]CCE24248.1 Calcium-transporting ATPase (modular protein) [Methylotuvimicrobium alcaliphilum 20Z]